MRTIMEAALDAQQLAASTLQLTKPHVALQINNRSFESAPKLLDARIPCLKTRQVLVKPFTDVNNPQVSDVLKVLR